MTVVGELTMCKECGNCNKEHTKSLDDAIDIVEDLGF